jgi:hypothetical protein
VQLPAEADAVTCLDAVAWVLVGGGVDGGGVVLVTVAVPVGVDVSPAVAVPFVVSVAGTVVGGVEVLE